MSNSLATLSVAQLKRAVTIKEHIAELEGELAALVGSESAAAPQGRRKGKMSAAGRARIVAAQKARWAKIKAGKTTFATKSAGKKVTMSASAKAAISRAAKARWAKIKAAKKG